MKKIFLTTIVSFVTLLAIADKGIVVTQKFATATTDAGVTLTWYVTANNVKLSMQFKDSKVNNTITHFIPNTKDATLQIYTDGPVPDGVQKSYYATPASAIKPSTANQYTRIDVKASGEVKEVSGIKCEKYIITTNLNITEAWVTKNVKFNTYQYHPYFPDNTPLLGLYNAQINGVVLSAVTKDLTGKELSKYELMGAQEKDIPATEFSIPEEYKRAQ
ncbi:MAG: DUF4412 domain-containing protein [Chitinophagales bacterium]|nr:DUF4412 domain-containing protein [Chitinophagales bacterium]